MKGGGHSHHSGSEKHLENSTPGGFAMILRSLMCGIWPASAHAAHPGRYGQVPSDYQRGKRIPVPYAVSCAYDRIHNSAVHCAVSWKAADLQV